MKKALFVIAVALFSACSTSQESASNASSTVVRGKAIKFESVDRCLTVPDYGDMSGRTAMRHSRCGQENRQTFLLSRRDIKAEGHFGPYVTERAGKIVAGSSSPWAFSQNTAGKLVVVSRLSNKCLVAGSSLLVELGDCNAPAAAVQLLDASQLPGRERVRDASWTVACGTDNQGNAEDCI